MASISNSEIKLIKSLKDKKFRDKYGLFVVEGEKLVDEALRSRFEVERVLRRDDIGEEAMSRITQLSSPSPVLALVRKPTDIEIDTHTPTTGLHLALDGIRDPGNLGTIIRIADWFGIDTVYASPDTVDIFNPKVVQSTMGAIFRVRFHYTSIPVLCKTVYVSGGRVYGTFLDGSSIYTRDLSDCTSCPSIIVIGNEANGISDATAAHVTDRLYIPPFPPDDPGSESLNAAVATAITVAEFRRQAL
ncbi:MAG: RNA methyltransferase [Bacteroidales bacterium]|nr:RNA methyltransferase [Bacteroidales bacterium]